MISRAKSDAGFLIVEVVISAALLLLVAVAVFATLDKSDSLAANQQRRTLAANLAQSEIERIRSIAVTDAARLGLVNPDTGEAPTQTGKIPELSGTQTLTEDGIDYKIETETRWGDEHGGELGQESGGAVTGSICTTPTGGLDFLRSTVKVTWKGMDQTLQTTKPVVMSSSLTTSPGARPGGTPASGTGSVMVHIFDRDGANLPGVSVQINGPETFSGTTNANGCILFPSVLADNDYTLTFSSPGKVDGEAKSPTSDLISVGPGKMNKFEYQLDTAAHFRAARFQYRDIVVTNAPCGGWFQPSCKYGPQDFAAQAEFLALDAGQPKNPRVIDVGTGTSWSGSEPIFPFTGQYAVYAGTCRDNLPPNPTTWFSANRGSQIDVTAQPIRLVGYNFEIDSGSLSQMRNGVVNVTPGCGHTYERPIQNDGKMLTQHRGFPYGEEVDVCVSAQVRFSIFGLGGSWKNRRWQGLVPMTNLQQQTSRVIDFPTTDIGLWILNAVDGIFGLWDGQTDDGQCGGADD